MKRSGDHTSPARVAARFWPKVDVRGPFDCWDWTGTKDDDGYGHLKMSGSSPEAAHRLSYRFAHGAIPEGLFVCHRCDNPSCVNPAHLFAATHRDNMADMRAKGRQATGMSVAHPKLTTEQARDIRRIYATTGRSQRDIAAEFGVHQMTVSRVVRREVWADA